jgi:hypothetical protein
MTTALALPQSLATEAEETALTLPEVEGLTIVDVDDRDFAASMLVIAVEKQKVIEAERVKITRPLHEAKTAADAFFKRVRAPYERGEAILREKIGAFELAHRAQQVAAAVAISEGSDSTELLAPLPPAKGVAVKEAWAFTVMDGAQVPREFLCIDEAALKAHCKGDGVPAPVPGVVFRKVATTRMVPGK